VVQDLEKRAKEFSAEFDLAIQHFPDAKFVVIYLVPQHELKKKDEIRSIIEAQREGKRPYGALILSEDELSTLLKKFDEWGVPRQTSLLRKPEKC